MTKPGLAIAIAGLAACGPMYADPPQQRSPQQQPQTHAGPPGADPWAPPATASPGDDRRPEDPWAGQPEPAPMPEPAAAPPKPARPQKGLTADAQALLDAHNRHRKQHCAQPLTWSPKLAEVAQRWADTLKAKGCKFGHSNGKYGENLAGGTSGTLDGQAVVDMWYDEIKLYSWKGGGGFSMQTGHFTQVVWRQTSQLGCGKTTCNGMDIWVCEYDPPGNVDTMYRTNVLPKGCK